MGVQTKKSANLNFNGIKQGEMLSVTYYLRVLSVDKGTGSIQVEDQNGQKFTVRGKDLIQESMYSGEQYSEEKKVSRTEATNILRNAGDTVFTVEFEKADGQTRVLTGHLIDTENEFGRSNVVDLEIIKGHPLRQVDHRTINWIVFKGVKYTVK